MGQRACPASVLWRALPPGTLIWTWFAKPFRLHFRLGLNSATTCCCIQGCWKLLWSTRGPLLDIPQHTGPPLQRGRFHYGRLYICWTMAGFPGFLGCCITKMFPPLFYLAYLRAGACLVHTGPPTVVKEGQSLQQCCRSIMVLCKLPVQGLRCTMRTQADGRWIAWHRQNRIAWHRRIRIAWHRPVCLTMSLVAKVRYHPTPHPANLSASMCAGPRRAIIAPPPANPSASMCASPRYFIVPHQQTCRLVCIIPPSPPQGAWKAISFHSVSQTHLVFCFVVFIKT